MDADKAREMCDSCKGAGLHVLQGVKFVCDCDSGDKYRAAREAIAGALDYSPHEWLAHCLRSGDCNDAFDSAIEAIIATARTDALREAFEAVHATARPGDDMRLACARMNHANAILALIKAPA